MNGGPGLCRTPAALNEPVEQILPLCGQLDTVLDGPLMRQELPGGGAPPDRVRSGPALRPPRARHLVLDVTVVFTAAARRGPGPTRCRLIVGLIGRAHRDVFRASRF